MQGWRRTEWDSSPGPILFTTVPSQGSSNILFVPYPPPRPSLSKFSILLSLHILWLVTLRLTFPNSSNIYISATAYSFSLPFQGSQDLPRSLSPPFPLSLEPHSKCYPFSLLLFRPGQPPLAKTFTSEDILSSPFPSAASSSSSQGAEEKTHTYFTPPQAVYPQ